MLLTDLNLPGQSGIELIQWVKTNFPELDIMVFTVSEIHRDVIAAIRAGASGYLLKGSTPRVLIESLKDLHQGGAPMSPRIARQLLTEIRKDDTASQPHIHLTQMELKVINLVDRGLTYAEISAKLHISPHTVHTHIKHIYEKIHASSRGEMLTKARKLGVI